MRKCLLVLSVSLPLLLAAQPAPNSYGPGGGTQGLPAGGENQNAPLGGGAIILLVFAAAWGVGKNAQNSIRKRDRAG